MKFPVHLFRRWPQMIVGAACLAMEVHAGPPSDITSAEIAVLPRYCAETQTFPRTSAAAISRWSAVYGQVFIHFHHYCWAQIWLMRADRPGTSDIDRRGNLASALDDTKYVIKYLSADHPLLGEMTTQKGKVLCRMGKQEDGIKALREVVATSPNNWRAVNELAKCHEGRNETSIAAQVLDDGLKHNPSSPVLRLYLEELKKKGKAPSAAQR